MSTYQSGVFSLSDADGTILTDHWKIKDGWQEYFKELLDEKKPRKYMGTRYETSCHTSRIKASGVRKQQGQFQFEIPMCLVNELSYGNVYVMRAMRAWKQRSMKHYNFTL